MTSCHDVPGHVGVFARLVKDNLGWQLQAVGNHD